MCPLAGTATPLLLSLLPPLPSVPSAPGPLGLPTAGAPPAAGRRGWVGLAGDLGTRGPPSEVGTQGRGPLGSGLPWEGLAWGALARVWTCPPPRPPLLGAHLSSRAPLHPPHALAPAGPQRPPRAPSRGGLCSGHPGFRNSPGAAPACRGSRCQDSPGISCGPQREATTPHPLCGPAPGTWWDRQPGSWPAPGKWDTEGQPRSPGVGSGLPAGAGPRGRGWLAPVCPAPRLGTPVQPQLCPVPRGEVSPPRGDWVGRSPGDPNAPCYLPLPLAQEPRRLD